MLKYKRWKEVVTRIGLLLMLGAMAQDFITGSYSPTLLAAGCVLLITGLVVNMVEQFFEG